MLTTAILILLVLAFLVDVIVFSYERYDWSIGIMVASIAVAYFGTPYIKDFIASAGWLPILTKYLPGYIVLGLGTAVVKWIIFSYKHIKGIKAIKAKFDVAMTKDLAAMLKFLDIRQDRNGNPTRDADQPFTDCEKRIAFVGFYKDKLEYGSQSRKHIYTDDVDFNKPTAIVDALTPRAKENVGIISIWVFQWPIVIVSLLFSDLLMKITRIAANVLDAVFSAVSRAMVANATKGL